MTRSPVNAHRGFTLIELIVVIILIGIVSVYAASRYIGTSGFSAIAAQEQAISIIRQIQLARMYSNVSDPNDSSQDNYRLSISSDCLGSEESCLSGSALTRSNRLEVNDDISFSSNYSTVSFDLLGNPENGAVKISISSGSESEGVCINEQGYVYGC